MKSSEFPDAINKLAAALTAAMPAINERMAMDASAMVKDRVVNTGKGASGAELGSYSNNELPAYFFEGKSLNDSGETFYLNAKKKGTGISYKQWREANNRPTDHVSLSFSGTTMKDIGVRKQLVEGAKIVTSVGAKNTKVRENGDSTEKIVDEYLGPQYGNFLEPNAEETEKLRKNLETEVTKIINESLA